jgi:hypothetical protein
MRDAAPVPVQRGAGNSKTFKGNTFSGAFFLFKGVLWALRCSMPSSETDTYTADREI